MATVFDCEQSATTGLEKRVDRFVALDSRFAAIDARFASIDRRFNAIERRFERIDRQFERIHRGQDQPDAQTSRLFRWSVGLQIAILVIVVAALLAR